MYTATIRSSVLLRPDLRAPKKAAAKARRKPAKRVAKKKGKKAPKKEGFVEKQNIATQPAFNMFGYRLAPSVPIMAPQTSAPNTQENMKMELVLSRIGEQQRRLEEQKQQLESIQDVRQPSGIAGMIPMYQLENEKRLQRMEGAIQQGLPVLEKAVGFQQETNMKRLERNARARERRATHKGKDKMGSAALAPALPVSTKAALPLPPMPTASPITNITPIANRTRLKSKAKTTKPKPSTDSD
jgi:hypothetical protein